MLKIVLFALVVILVTGCKDEPTEKQTDTRDAGVVITALESSELKIRVPLLPSWRAAEVEPSRPGEAETIGAARRLPQQRMFTAAPRIVMTAEPTTAKDVEPILEATLDDLKSIGKRENVTVIRTAKSTRPISGATLGDAEMVYRISAGEKGAKSIVHRSVLVIRERRDGSRVLVTITASYLLEDRELVGAEVQVMLDGVELYE